MSKGLAELLGFEWYKWASRLKPSDAKLPKNSVEKLNELPDGTIEVVPSHALSYTATNVCDMQRGFYALYVYCDVAEHVVVGHSKAPLLRAVNVAGKEGLTISKIYQTIQYVPVQKKQFESIEIDIRDDAGRKVPFERGSVIVTLHFRMKTYF